MTHGTEQYFQERARSDRGVSSLAVGLALALLAVVLAPLLPPVRSALERLTSDVPMLRFGFAGPTRVVEIVRFDAVPDPGALRDVGTVTSPSQRRGRGAGDTRPTTREGPPPGDRRPIDPGDAPQDLVARALSGQSGLQLFQSEDLIIEHLVRPTYPEGAIDAGSEGSVRVLALVDTFGLVIDAALLDKSGDPEIDVASIDAVRQCRFRPYQENGLTKEVYAVFRFVFRIY